MSSCACVACASARLSPLELEATQGMLPNAMADALLLLLLQSLDARASEAQSCGMRVQTCPPCWPAVHGHVLACSAQPIVFTDRKANSTSASCDPNFQCPTGSASSVPKWYVLDISSQAYYTNCAVRCCSAVCAADARLCLLYTSPSPRDRTRSRMPSSA